MPASTAGRQAGESNALPRFRQAMNLKRTSEFEAIPPSPASACRFKWCADARRLRARWPGGAGPTSKKEGEGLPDFAPAVAPNGRAVCAKRAVWKVKGIAAGFRVGCRLAMPGREQVAEVSSCLANQRWRDEDRVVQAGCPIYVFSRGWAEDAPRK
jgi:hypothetical protein